MDAAFQAEFERRRDEVPELNLEEARQEEFQQRERVQHETATQRREKVIRLLSDEKLASLSDHEIARQVGVVPKTVADIRRRMMAAETDQGQPNKPTKDEVRQMQREKLAARLARHAASEPDASAANVDKDDDQSSAPKPPVVFNRGNETLTTSLAVAEAFGKLHKDVLKAIDFITKTHSEVLRRENFVFRQTVYVSSRGRSERMFEMNEDAFCLLVGGFTGVEALRFRAAYILEFNRMRRALHDIAAAGFVPSHEMAAVGGRMDRLEASLGQVVGQVGQMVTAVSEMVKSLPAFQAQTEPPMPERHSRFPGGTRSLTEFCHNHPDITLDWFRQFLSKEGIKEDGMGPGYLQKDPTTGCWVCTARVTEDRIPLFVDIKGVAIINGVDRPYAHITPAGEKHFSKVLHELRKQGPLKELASRQGMFDLRAKNGTGS